MVNIHLRAIVAAALLMSGVHSKRIYLNFEDLATSNEHSCGVSTLTAETAYHGVFVTSNFGPVSVFNTTKTAKCSTSTFGVFDQSRATSGANVAFGSTGGFEAQIDSETIRLINAASFDVSVVLTAAERKNSDNIITINTELADFSTFSVTKQLTFHTAKDGFGPYHIVAPNTGKYIFLSVEAGVGVPGKSFRQPALFVDNVSLETTEA